MEKLEVSLQLAPVQQLICSSSSSVQQCSYSAVPLLLQVQLYMIAGVHIALAKAEECKTPHINSRNKNWLGLVAVHHIRPPILRIR